jgi:hypothetical protein
LPKVQRFDLQGSGYVEKRSYIANTCLRLGRTFAAMSTGACRRERPFSGDAPMRQALAGQLPPLEGLKLEPLE